MIRNLRPTFNIAYSLAISELKQKYEGSYLGILWYLLNPLLVFLLLLAVFSTRLGSGIAHYPLYLLLGIIMYSYLQETTQSALVSMEDNRNLIKSIAFPREALVVSGLMKSIFTHLIELIVFCALALIMGVNIFMVIAYPMILLFFSFFIYGLSLLLASLYLYVNDISNLWSFAIRLLFFATPIFYAIEGQNRLLILNLFNPLYYFITIARETIIYNTLPSIYIIMGAIAWAFGSIIIATLIFNRLKYRFAERL